MQFKYHLNPRNTAISLGILAVFFALQSLLTEYLLENVLRYDADGLLISIMDLFSVNAEGTIPTWYATLLLFITAVLLAFIASTKYRTGAPYRLHWAGLAVIFLYLSIDEGVAIHEIFSDPLQELFNTSGYLTFGWLIIFVPLLLLFALAYLRFLIHLPPRTRNLFILAGIIYVGGAVIVESISANRWDLDGGVTFPYLAIATVEEFFEMAGIIVFIYALLSYAAENSYTAVITPQIPAPDNTIKKPISSRLKWLLAGVTILIIGLNIALLNWATAYQSESVIDPRTIPFYQAVSDRYSDQGVIILGINDVLEPNNPAAPQYANSLLTLFDDVIVVILPTAKISIAFASQSLPFDQALLEVILRESGETDYLILGTPEIRSLAENSGDTP